MIRSSLQKKTGFDVLSCNPSQQMLNIQIPCMFILGDSDELVRFSLFKDMFDSCPADRKKFQLEEDCRHADPRSEKCIRNVFEFLGEQLDSPVDPMIYNSAWEQTFNVGNQTKELLMDLTGFDFLPSGTLFPGKIESVFEDSKIFGEEPEVPKKPKVASSKNLLSLRVDRQMIPTTTRIRKKKEPFVDQDN